MFYSIHYVVSYDNFLKRCNSIKIQTPVTVADTMSARGAAYKMPFNPKIFGRIMMDGMSKITCLVIVRNMADLIFPTA